MLPDLRQEVRPRRDDPQPRQHQACWPGVGLDGCLQVPVPPLSPAERPDAPRREIERADSPRPKAVEPGLDAQQDDWLARVQRGSWMGCGSLRDLATVVPRRPHGLRLRLRPSCPASSASTSASAPRAKASVAKRDATMDTPTRRIVDLFTMSPVLFAVRVCCLVRSNRKRRGATSWRHPFASLRPPCRLPLSCRLPSCAPFSPHRYWA